VYGKLAGGAMLGVFLPIGIEYVVKGADISPSLPIKWSGVIGTGIGFVTGVLPIFWKGHPVAKMTNEGTKHFMIAFGASSFATGISILILEWLRNTQGYAFAESLPISLREEGVVGSNLVRPVSPYLKEI
jgi:hypothetical protein